VVPMSQRRDHAVGYEAETGAGVSSEAIRAQLQRILASDLFLNAQRPSQFLRFIVETALAGHDRQIKEYVLGVDVFGRPADYDPKDDPVVRIEAGRLRKKLSEYYSGLGVKDPIIIEVPRGGYIPVFRPQAPNRELEIVKPAGIAATGDRPTTRKWTVQPLTVVAAGLVAIVSFVPIYLVRQRHRPVTTPTSIAVLPFLNLTTAPAEAYLTDGVAEELTTGLAQIKGLRVVAATSAFQFRGKAEDVRKIGQSLNAEALLEGSISQSEGSLRINAQLIDARNGFHLWSKGYDAKPSDLVASEQDILQETARTLRIPLNPSAHPIKRDTESTEAHDLYLHGRYLWNTRQLPDMLESLRLFKRAIKDDPNYALAYSGLADTYTVMTINTQMSPAEAVPLAKAALQRALELDPNLARAHATEGLLESQCEWNWHGAEDEFRKAIALDPNYAPAHHWAGLNFMEMGQFSAADAEFRTAQVLDPLSPMITEGRAENFYDWRRYDDAISVVLNMPDQRVGWLILANAYIFKGMYQQALKIPNVGNPNDMNGFIIKAAALARSGDRNAGLKILTDLEERHKNAGASEDYIPPGYLAWGYAMAGDKERSLLYLEKAYEQRDPTLANLKVDPGFDILRSDPRFTDLLHKVGFDN
jgi:TolB-like protein/lipoprotein NlpI